MSKYTALSSLKEIFLFLDLILADGCFLFFILVFLCKSDLFLGDVVPALHRLFQEKVECVLRAFTDGRLRPVPLKEVFRTWGV